MNKIDVIQQLRSARRAHLRWVKSADALIQGIPLDKNQVPIESTDCTFGQWYNRASDDIHAIPGFEEINQPHEMLHSIYREIFTLLIPEKKKGLISRLFGSKPVVSEKNTQEARILFQLLKEQSDLIVEQLDRMEQQLL